MKNIADRKFFSVTRFPSNHSMQMNDQMQKKL